jgi:hypothetical protein
MYKSKNNCKIYRTKHKPPEFQTRLTVAFFHPIKEIEKDIIEKKTFDGYWTLEPDYRFVDLWTKKGRFLFPAAISKKESSIINITPERLGEQTPIIYCRVGKLPHFLTDKEPQSGQLWDYSIEGWSYDPVQPEPTDLSKYPLSDELKKVLTDAIAAASSGATCAPAITELVETIEALDATIGELKAKSEEDAERIATLETTYPVEIPEDLTDYLVQIKESGEVPVADFVLDDSGKKFVHTFPMGVAIDRAVFYMGEGRRGSINVHIKYLPLENQYQLWFFKGALNKLKKEVTLRSLEFDSSGFFVKWKTYED